MQESTTPQNSSDPQLAETLRQLRQLPHLRRLLQAYQRTTLPTWRPSHGKDEKDWIYASGAWNAERRLMEFLLGDDPAPKLEVND